MTNHSPELTRRLYASMHRIRRVEEEVARVYPTDKIQSPVHLSIGQEAVAVGVCDPLAVTDTVYGTYRSHAMYLAKGGDLPAMVAELYGRATGCAKGKGGSMHLVDTAHGVMGTSAVVATTIPLAVGHALANRVLGNNQVVVSFFGDGATEEGAFHESLNFAALKQLPVLFVCENNFYAIHTPLAARQAPGGTIAERAMSYGIDARCVKDGDVFSIRRHAQEAIDTMRRTGKGPFFLECMIYRWKEHVGPNEDYHFGYRAEVEAQPWRDADQLTRLAGLIDPATRVQLDDSIEQEVRAAFEFAEASPEPDLAELYTDLT